MNEILAKEVIESAQMFFVFWLSCNIGSNVGSFLNKRTSLKKLSNYENKLLVDDKVIRENIEKIKEDKIFFGDISKIRTYLDTLIKYLDDEDKRLLYINLKTLNVKNNPLNSNLGLAGYYDVLENKLSYSTRSSLGHELIHMASAFKFDDYVLCGFKQRKDKFEIGRGINEGYTELLTSRLFSRGNVEVYKNEVKIMRLIEKFFDDPKELSHLFFNCNLPGLVKHLEKFSSRDEVISLILDIDKINRPSVVFWDIMPKFQSIKTQLTLYNWFSKHNKDPEKLKEFEDILFEDKMVKFLVQGQKFKLNKDQKYCTDLNEIKKIR